MDRNHFFEELVCWSQNNIRMINDFVISYRGVLMSGKNSLNSFLKRAEKLIFHMVGKGQMALYFMRFVGR